MQDAFPPMLIFPACCRTCPAPTTPVLKQKFHMPVLQALQLPAQPRSPTPTARPSTIIARSAPTARTGSQATTASWFVPSAAIT